MCGQVYVIGMACRPFRGSYIVKFCDSQRIPIRIRNANERTGRRRAQAGSIDAEGANSIENLNTYFYSCAMNNPKVFGIEFVYSCNWLPSCECSYVDSASMANLQTNVCARCAAPGLALCIVKWITINGASECGWAWQSHLVRI